MTGAVAGSFTAAVGFTDCTASSLSDAGKSLLFRVSGKLCYINQRATELGLYWETTEAVHLESVRLIGY